MILAFILSIGLLSGADSSALPRTSGGTPTAQQNKPEEGPPDEGGYVSVANRAEQEWGSAYDALREQLKKATPCDPASQAALALARQKLEQRTSAWRKVYTQTGVDLGGRIESVQKALADDTATLKSEEEEAAKTNELISNLKERRTNLEQSRGPNANVKALNDAASDLDEMIKVHQEMLEATLLAIKHRKDIIENEKASTEVDQRQTVKMSLFEHLTDQQDILYASFIRSRQTRLNLLCKPAPPPPPPPIRMPNE